MIGPQSLPIASNAIPSAAEVIREATERLGAAVECGQLIIEVQGSAATAIAGAQRFSVNAEHNRHKGKRDRRSARICPSALRLRNQSRSGTAGDQRAKATCGEPN